MLDSLFRCVLLLHSDNSNSLKQQGVCDWWGNLSMNSFVSCQTNVVSHTQNKLFAIICKTPLQQFPDLFADGLLEWNTFAECWIHLKILVHITLCRTLYVVGCTLRCCLWGLTTPEQTPSSDFIIPQIARKNKGTAADCATERHFLGMITSMGKQLWVPRLRALGYCLLIIPVLAQLRPMAAILWLLQPQWSAEISWRITTTQKSTTCCTVRLYWL